jgi:hypothetical protein
MRCPISWRWANEQRFEAFYDLLLDALARLASARATRQGGQMSWRWLSG